MAGDSLGCNEGDPLGLLAPFAPMLPCSASGGLLLSADFTAAPTTTSQLDAYALTGLRYVADENGRQVSIPENAVPLDGLRPVRNLFADSAADTQDFSGWSAVNSATATVAGFDFVSGSSGAISPAAGGKYPETDAGTHFAARAKVTSDVDVNLRIVLRNNTDFLFMTDAGGVALSAGVPLTIGGDVEQVTTGECYLQLQVVSPTSSGSITIEELQVEDITPRADLDTSPSEYVSVGVESAPYHGAGVDGFEYFDVERTTSVDGSNVVSDPGGGASIEGNGLDLQPGVTNLADTTDDLTGGADTITLSATGNYTLSVYGTAAVTIAAGTATITGGAQATEGSPVTINCTATGTVTLTLDGGTLDAVGADEYAIQLESGTVATGWHTSSTTRNAISTYPTYSDIPASNETRFVVDGANVDIDDWDGVIDTDVVGADSLGQVESVTVYDVGERPA